MVSGGCEQKKMKQMNNRGERKVDKETIGAIETKREIMENGRKERGC